VDLREKLKTNWQWTWGRVNDRWTKDKEAVDGGKVKDPGSGLWRESRTGGPKTNWQWTWGRVKDRWTKDKLTVDLGEKSKTGRPKTN
jgi:hypothetical protein